MGDFPDSAMIALLPTNSEWCQIEFPHMTLVFVGEISDLSQSLLNDLAKTALSISLEASPIILEVLGLDVFGGGSDQEVDVFTLRPTPELLAMRLAVEDWNASQYKTFRPHVTIGPVGCFEGEMPETITFDRICVSWGETNLIYKFMQE